MPTVLGQWTKRQLWGLHLGAFSAAQAAKLLSGLRTEAAVDHSDLEGRFHQGQGYRLCVNIYKGGVRSHLCQGSA